MERVFEPRSLVVIGVSSRPGNLASGILANLRSFSYSGDLYAVGRGGGTVHGVPVSASLDDVPDGLDLAVILTPAAMVIPLVEACGRKGIRRVVVESGGFAEFSAEGKSLEAQLLETARRYGIRIVGPNCISVSNFEKGVALPFVPLSPRTVRLGSVSVVAQSGGLAVSYIERLSWSGVGVNKAVSIGNKADYNETDYLEWLLGDPGTRVVLLYLESISDGRRLMEVARASTKPIIVHKANTGAASRSIAQSHTAALAGDDQVASAAMRQAGMFRVATIREAVAVAQGLVLPPVQGKRLLVVSRSGGHAVMAADAVDRWGFELPCIPEDLAQRIRELNPADVIAPTNPIDVGTVFDFRVSADIAQVAARALHPDAILLVTAYFAPEFEMMLDLARRMGTLADSERVPVALCVHAPEGDLRPLQRELSVPVFAEIEEAAEGLAASRDRHAWCVARGVGLSG